MDYENRAREITGSEGRVYTAQRAGEIAALNARITQALRESHEAGRVDNEADISAALRSIAPGDAVIVGGYSCVPETWLRESYEAGLEAANAERESEIAWLLRIMQTRSLDEIRDIAGNYPTKEGGGAESPNARAASGEAGSGERARPSPPASPSPSSPPDSGAFAALRLACANEALRTEPRDGKAGLYRRIMAIKIPSDAAPAVLPDSEGGSAATDLPEQRGDTPGASANSAPSSPSDREAFEAYIRSLDPDDIGTLDWDGACDGDYPVLKYPDRPDVDICEAWQDFRHGWQASRAALPTREEIAETIQDVLLRRSYGTFALDCLPIADAVLALIGGDDE